MATFTILHISDAHIGHPSYELDIKLALGPLVDDLRDLRANSGLAADLVIFSGDLAYGQLRDKPIADQYNVAREFLSGITHEFTVPLFLVPGNHDVNWDRIEASQQEWLQDNIGEDDKLERDARAQSSTWKGLIARQKDWVDFVSTLPLKCEYSLDPSTLLSRGRLESSIGTVNLIGLNTAWASSISDRRGSLRLGPHQFKQLRSMRRDMEGLVICIGHHPPNWLHSPEGADLDKWLEAETDLFLHGHEHDVWFKDMPSHLRVAAGACYQGSKESNVYQWIQLDPASRRTKLTLRTFNTRGGADVWGAYAIFNKTDDHGIATTNSPFGSPELNVADTSASPIPDSSTLRESFTESAVDPGVHAATAGGFSQLDLQAFIHFIDEHLHFRWEPKTFRFSDAPVSVFWPVRLRSPTAIHAVQAFAAAALSRKGAKVCLSLDDFGNVQYRGDAFVAAVKSWWTKVGADPDLLEVEYFQQVLSTERSQELWQTIQLLFGKSDFDLQHVLRLSKYLPPRADTEIVFGDFAAKRPRKLLTPTLVWTTLLGHLEARSDHKIITLGGSDEQELWKTWWDVVSPERGGFIGHLFNPELLIPHSGEDLPLHMGAVPDFGWQARGDVVRWFERDLQAQGEWSHPSRMLPWCFNGCVRLPAFVSETEQVWRFGSHVIANDADLRSIISEAEIKEASESLATLVSRNIL